VFLLIVEPFHGSLNFCNTYTHLSILSSSSMTSVKALNFNNKVVLGVSKNKVSVPSVIRNWI
jgi:hypothetical protein